jgi:hypothetical protein
MLTTTELWLNSFIVYVLLPLVLLSLLSKTPRAGILEKLHMAEPRLLFAQNLFVLMLCALSALNLARHYGIVDAVLGAQVSSVLDIAFMASFLLFTGLFGWALVKLRRGSAQAG